MRIPREDLLPGPRGGRHIIGARAITPDNWLSPDEESSRLVELRKAVTSQHPQDVFACLAGHESLVERVLSDFPRDGGDDLCVLVEREGKWILAGADLCFPNRWVLTEKLGLSVMAIHDPVPGYAQQVGAGVDSLLNRLSDGRIVERSNWGVSDTGEYFEPRIPPPRPELEPADLWLRIERQTLRQIEDDVILFSIRTYMESMNSVRSRGDDVAENLAGAIDELPPDVLNYKSLTPYRDQLLAFLRSS
jgi:hypothetical protein